MGTERAGELIQRPEILDKLRGRPRPCSEVQELIQAMPRRERHFDLIATFGAQAEVALSVWPGSIPSKLRRRRMSDLLRWEVPCFAARSMASGHSDTGQITHIFSCEAMHPMPAIMPPPDLIGLPGRVRIGPAVLRPGGLINTEFAMGASLTAVTCEAMRIGGILSLSLEVQLIPIIGIRTDDPFYDRWRSAAAMSAVFEAEPYGER